MTCLGNAFLSHMGGGGGGGGNKSSSFEVIGYGTPQMGGGGYFLPLPRWGLFFFFFFGTKTRFGCIIKFKLTPIVAQNVYDCSTGVEGNR